VVADLAGLVRDGAADAAAVQAGAVLAGGVRLVSPHEVEANTWPTRPGAGHTNPVHHRFELRRVAALPGRHYDRHGLLFLFDGQVQLGGEPAARPTQPVIMRLGEDAAR
jgi:hypothetical protein